MLSIANSRTLGRALMSAPMKTTTTSCLVPLLKQLKISPSLVFARTAPSAWPRLTIASSSGPHDAATHSVSTRRVRVYSQLAIEAHITATDALPQTAYGRVMSAQANFFRVKLLSTEEEGFEVPEVNLLRLNPSVRFEIILDAYTTEVTER